LGEGAARCAPAASVALLLERTLAARGESPAAFERRCIPTGCVAPPSNIPDIPDILGRHALPAGRLAVLGATPDFHHGLLDGALGRGRRADEGPARFVDIDDRRIERLPAQGVVAGFEMPRDDVELIPEGL